MIVKAGLGIGLLGERQRSRAHIRSARSGLRNRHPAVSDGVDRTSPGEAGANRLRFRFVASERRQSMVRKENKPRRGRNSPFNEGYRGSSISSASNGVDPSPFEAAASAGARRSHVVAFKGAWHMPGAFDAEEHIRIGVDRNGVGRRVRSFTSSRKGSPSPDKVGGRSVTSWNPSTRDPYRGVFRLGHRHAPWNSPCELHGRT